MPTLRGVIGFAIIGFSSMTPPGDGGGGGGEVETKSPPGSRPSPAPAPSNKISERGNPRTDMGVRGSSVRGMLLLGVGGEGRVCFLSFISMFAYSF